MDQMGFSELEFATKKRQTRRERFLDQIEAATPWALLLEQMEPFYPKGHRRPRTGRRCGIRRCTRPRRATSGTLG